MEKLQYRNFLFQFFLLFLLQFSSLLLLSSAYYTLPDHYFINCGSDSNDTVTGRTFIGDKYLSSSISPGRSSKSIETTNASADTSYLYQTARIYEKPYSYKLEITENGTYLVRFHFLLFPSSINLSAAIFNVSTSNVSLLSNFRVPNSSINSPVIKEFLLPINVGKFEINFIPCQETSLAFVNAMEVFLAPEGFITNDAVALTSEGITGTFDGLLSQVLQIVHRINVGGSTIMVENDTLWRKWIVDDDFILNSDAAKNSSFYVGDVIYEDGISTKYIAPDTVYRIAKELNRSFPNITWSFDVRKNARHLVRVHLCNIVSFSIAVLMFNLYIYDNFRWKVDPYKIVSDYAAPFHIDMVVDSDNSGFMNISVGPQKRFSEEQNALLNGVEIMELMKESSSIRIQTEPNKKLLFVIVGSIVGVVASIFILLVMVLGLKCQKAKPIGTLDGKAERTVNSIPVLNLNLGLRKPLWEVQYVTTNFDTKLMIGEGGFGKVYKGTLRNGMKVAVKRSEPGHDQGLLEFQRKIIV